MASHADIGVSQPAASTITMKVATVTLTRNSTAQHQELLTIADAESTNGLARVLAEAPASTEYGLGVRIISGPSSVADLAATVTLASTGNTVTARLTTSSGGSLEGSTVLPQTAGTLGLHVRPVFGAPQTFAASTVGQSSATVLVSSAATIPYVHSYVVASTESGPVVGGFYAGSTLVWPVVIGASIGVMQQTQQVSQPGYIFRGQADRPLEFRLQTSTVSAIHVGLSYWRE